MRHKNECQPKDFPHLGFAQDRPVVEHLGSMKREPRAA
jgi:hypothetical protein